MKLKKYLPKKEKEEPVLAQGYVPRELFDNVNKKREKLNITWNELMEALLKAFLDEKEL
jgi:hypothetical protein